MLRKYLEKVENLEIIKICKIPPSPYSPSEEMCRALAEQK